MKHIETQQQRYYSIFSPVLYVQRNLNRHCHKEAFQKSRCKFTSLMSIQEVIVVRKNALKQQEEGTLRGSRPQREPMLLWVKPESEIINHYSIQV